MTARPEVLTTLSSGVDGTRPVRVVIVDDEPLSRRAMRQLLDLRCDVEIVSECSSVAELECVVVDADLIFLDIQMPGQSGLDWRLKAAHGDEADGPPFVVFVTAFEEHAVAAFDAGPVDYLTKPVMPARLERAMSRVRERLEAFEALTLRREHVTVSPPTTQSAVARAPASPAPPISLVTRVGKREVILPLADVDVVMADGVYAAVRLEGRRHLVRRSLDDLERALGDARFLRVHRSYLVRRSAIVEARLGSTVRRRELVLTDGTIVPVSRRRQAAVARWIRT